MKRPPLNAWRRRFLGRVVGVCMLFQLPAVAWLAQIFVDYAHLPTGRAWALSAGLHLVHLGALTRRLVFWLDDHRAPAWRTWLLDVPAAVYATACLLGGVPGLVALIVTGVLHGLGVRDPSPGMVLSVVYLPALALSTWGTTVGRMVPWVRTREIEVAGLPEGFDGYRIAQLSDIHCGPYLPRWLYRYWARVTVGTKPDLVAVTGDFITSGEGYVDDVADLFTHLRASDGVVACLGNHDYFSATSGVASAITRGGARLLRNDGMAVTRGGDSLWIAGIDDRWSKRDDLDAALREKPDGAPTVLLAHDPSQFPDFVAKGVELTLSGHTHGGQYAVPGIPRANLARISTRYTVGKFVEGRSVLYVHRGNGTTGPPTRVGAPPEIAVLVLRAKR